jgi:hypothetical protein
VRQDRHKVVTLEDICSLTKILTKSTL